MICTIDLEFADGEFTFALPLPQISELQEKAGTGIGELGGRLMEGVLPRVNAEGELEYDYVLPLAKFHVLDIVETIRLGLIGGGKGVVNGEEVEVSAVKARQMVDRYVTPPAAPLIEGWKLALAIVLGCLKGFDPPKKAEPANKRAKKTPKAGSTSP